MAEKAKNQVLKEDLKIDPALLAFDVDGVCADTMGLFLDILRDEYRIDHIRYEDITCYALEKCLQMDQYFIAEVISKILEGNYQSELKPIAGAIDVLTNIGNCHGPLVFVTARPHPGPIDEWLRKLLPLASDRIDIVATGSFEAKTEILISKNKAYFLEDRLDTCYTLSNAGITPLVFRQPWNQEQHPFIEVKDWDDLEKLIVF
jgi:hypothetical protein